MLPWIGRVILIVLDGVGVGALPDAADYGDAGSNTLGHVAQATELRLPHLQRLGLGNILPLRGVPPAPASGAWGRMAERSAGKDSTVGHWELLGLVTAQPFPTYPHGFGSDILEPFAARTGRGVLGNRPASGTQIINELDQEHRRTGKWIVYTSADSVFQVAAHEQVVPPSELYAACQVAADLLLPTRRVLRVIARPYTGEPGKLRRTAGRRDFNPVPHGPTALDILSDAQCPVVTVGKVDSLFAGRGVTEAIRTAGNQETLQAILQELELARYGLLLANLVDFDMLWGHRNDVAGFARGLAAFDAALGEILPRLRPRDVLIITADHGCDPTFPGTDHTREHVPLLVTGAYVTPGTRLGTRTSFADVGATVCEALGVKPPPAGRSFWSQLAREPVSGRQDAEHRRVAWLRRRHLHGGWAC